MLEFVFFHELPTHQFTDWLQQKGIKPQTQQQEETFVITIPEEMDDDLYDQIEEKYDSLFEMNQTLMSDENSVHVASISVYLQDGRTSYANIEPGLLSKVMAAISPEELGHIVKAIVSAIETPQEKSCCQLQAEQNDLLSKERI